MSDNDLKYEFLPIDPINISSTAVSTEFQLVNNSSGPKKYIFTATQVCHVRRGYSDVSAATTSDIRFPANQTQFLWLAPGEGVRVIRTGIDGILQIGDLGI